MFFSFSIVSTCFKVLTILFLFVVAGCALCSYWAYYCQYGKLGRYFLSNMYRFKSSYLLMTLTFGIRPFSKGLVHAMFFESWNLQIWLLVGIEALTLILIILFEIVLDSHKCRVTLFFEVLYSFALIAMNVLLLCKHDYFSHNEEMLKELEVYMKLLVYFMLILWALRVVVEIKNSVECKCENKNRIKPENKINMNKEGEKKLSKLVIESNYRNDNLKVEVKDGVKYANFTVGREVIQVEIPNEEELKSSNDVFEYYMKKYPPNFNTQPAQKKKKNSKKHKKHRKR